MRTLLRLLLLLLFFFAAWRLAGRLLRKAAQVRERARGRRNTSHSLDRSEIVDAEWEEIERRKPDPPG